MIKPSVHITGVYSLSGDIPLFVGGRFIPPIEDMEELSKKILDFLGKYSQGDIDRYNQSEIDKINIASTDKREPKKQSLGYVYLLKGESDRYKIGCSKNPQKRVDILRLSSCENHTLIHSYKVENMYDEEKRLHEKFRERRCHSEWFTLSPLDVEYIMGIK